jgi:hypothetical protein
MVLHTYIVENNSCEGGCDGSGKGNLESKRKNTSSRDSTANHSKYFRKFQKNLKSQQCCEKIIDET